ncbi:MAG: AFG1 family ATPase [Burkholderiales bacterium]|nr:AFG1 family ATPase [Burkholderiales bacterium]
MRQYAHRRGIVLDAAQTQALARFERLYEDLLGLERMDSWLVRLLARRRVVRGLYLWGGVGRGKSFLMDAFFDCAPLTGKRRQHFHRFMQDVHHRMRDLQGQEDPLIQVARDLAQQARLLCLDEFQVSDITDAMLMRRLLEGLFEQGVVLVTTSNLQPDELYKHGLQREQFLPAIALIKQNLDVVHIDAGIDYRLRLLQQAGVYHYPLGAQADEKLAREFASIVSGEVETDVVLEIEQRPIRARRVGPEIAWFEFAELCEGPRGQADYIELARRFHTVLLSGVPQLRPSKLDAARRFTWLVDEFYDRRVKLIVSAAVAVNKLFAVAGSGDAFLRNLNASFVDRTVSRLIEMQTRDYLALPHLA